jgi:nitroreductase
MNAIPPMPRRADHAVDPQFTARWSPRAFGDETMSEAQILALLEAARWAPSAANVQPWRFAWGLRGDAAFGAIFDSLAPGNQAWAGRAAALVVIGSKTTRPTPEGAVVANGFHAFDAGAAWASLALQAHLAGWAAHGMGGFDPAKLSAALNLAEGHALHAVAAIGRVGNPEALPEALRARELPSGRKALAEIAGHGAFPA